MRSAARYSEDFLPTGIVRSIIWLLFIGVSCGAKCVGNREECNRYKCDSGQGVKHTALEYFNRPGRSIFTHPCKCAHNWSDLFCNQTLQLLAAPVDSNLPTLCICRKFADYGGSCEQFVTRCVKRKSGGCSCCFNQPDEFCDHVKCSGGEPDFERANTSCVCHSNPADYPTHICGLPEPPTSPPDSSKFVTSEEALNDVFFSLAGVELTQKTAVLAGIILLIILIVLLISVIVLTGRRKKKSTRQHHGASERNGGTETHESLLPQKRGEKGMPQYLP